jgi:hypothetical protein
MSRLKKSSKEIPKGVLQHSLPSTPGRAPGMW